MKEFLRFLKGNVIFCLLLWFITNLVDAFMLSPFYVHQIRFGYNLYGPLYFSGGVAISLVVSSVIFMSLRAVPFVGRVLSWITWAILTIPVYLFYLATGNMPSAQDLINLFYVRSDIAKATVLTFLSPSILLKVSVAIIVVVLFFVMAGKIFNLRKMTTRGGGITSITYCSRSTCYKRILQTS